MREKKKAKQIYIKIGRMDHKHKSDKTEKATILDKLIKKKKKEVGNGKSRDSPEIPDRRETSLVSGLPSRAQKLEGVCIHTHKHAHTHAHAHARTHTHTPSRSAW